MVTNSSFILMAFKRNVECYLCQSALNFFVKSFSFIGIVKSIWIFLATENIPPISSVLKAFLK